MQGLATDNGPKTNDRLDIFPFRQPQGNKRNFQGSGHPRDGDIRFAHTVLEKFLKASIEQPPGDEVVEFRRYNTDFLSSAAGFAFECRDHRSNFKIAGRT